MTTFHAPTDDILFSLRHVARADRLPDWDDELASEITGHFAAFAEGRIAPLDAPLKATGHLTIMRGNFCPGSAVSKLTGKEGLFFDGKAICFDDEVSVLKAVEQGRIVAGNVVIIRYCGPKGAPGCPEQLASTSAEQRTASALGTSCPKQSMAGPSLWCKMETGSQLTQRRGRSPGMSTRQSSENARQNGKRVARTS